MEFADDNKHKMFDLEAPQDVWIEFEDDREWSISNLSIMKLSTVSDTDREKLYMNSIVLYYH